MRTRKSFDEIKAALESPDRGREAYEPCDYLWHLAAIGVIDLDQRNAVTGVIWGDDGLGRDPARIALIDSGVAYHPNLINRVLWDRAADFGSRDAGAFYRRALSGGEASAARPAGFAGDLIDPVEEGARLPGLDDPNGPTASAASEDRLRKLIAGLDLADAGSEVVALLRARLRKHARTRDVSAQDQHYPSHGTASAGMAVGTPVFEAEAFGPTALPYFGVDPFSQIIPIATSAEPEPIQLMLALVYSLANDADLILMPRGADKARPDARDGGHGNRYDDLGHAWELFDKVMIAISKKIPIICAAGNSGLPRIEYPASLAAADNGIVAVGAVTPVGHRSGFGCYGAQMTLVAPSNDDRVYTRHQLRLDPQAPEAADHNWLIHDYAAYNDYGNKQAFVDYCREAPLSIDIPGPRGYRSGSATRPGQRSDDLQSLYAWFGGTSAAACQVAGVVALMRRAAGTARGWSGLSVKAALQASCDHEIFGNELAVDYASAGDFALDAEGKLGRHQFGHGLISAKRAIVAARKIEGEPGRLQRVAAEVQRVAVALVAGMWAAFS